MIEGKKKATSYDTNRFKANAGSQDEKVWEDAPQLTWEGGEIKTPGQ